MSNDGAKRALASAVAGRELDTKDPPIMEQWCNEIDQAASYIQTQMCRLRNNTDSLFGAQPVNETTATDQEKMAEVRPHYDRMAESIRHLHNATGELNDELERLEGHRLV